MIYLDYAAATPVDERVLAAMNPYLLDKFYNPSASYLAAKRVREDYEEAKHQIASLIGARSAEIIMTAGATESINIALSGVSGGIITSAIEHPAVLVTAKNRDAKIVSVDDKGRINLDELTKIINDETELISIGYINNEIGTIQLLGEIAEIVANERRKRLANGSRKQLLLHTDASQATGYADINVARLGVDLMTLNAGKCYGPKQVGLLYVRAGVKLTPTIFGGGQEMGLRSGTENVAGTIGFARALTLADKSRKSEVRRQELLRDGLEKFLQETFPDLKINGDRRHRTAGILNFSLVGLDGERALFALDQRGVMVSTGSACAANSGLRSHVLTAIGLSDELADGSLRISLGRSTTTEEIEQLKVILKDVLIEQLKFGVQNA